VHWPVPGKHVLAYKHLEELRAEGKIRSLGVSNYTARARPERSIALGVLHSESGLHGGFVWARRALNSRNCDSGPGRWRTTAS
jgi:hypothetical protein